MKKIFRYAACGKECVSPRGLKRSVILKHVLEELKQKTQKKHVYYLRRICELSKEVCRYM